MATADQLPPAISNPSVQNPHALAQKISDEFHARQKIANDPTLDADISILEKASTDTPSDALLFTALSYCYSIKGNLKAIEDNARKAYALSPTDTTTGLMYALSLKMNKQPLRALEVVRKMATIHPHPISVEYMLATLEVLTQKYPEAIAILETLKIRLGSSATKGDELAFDYLLITCYLYTGDYAKAEEFLKAGIASLPHAALYWGLLGEIYLKSGDMDKADEALDKAISLGPNGPSSLYYKGIVLQKQNMPELANEAFEKTYNSEKPMLRQNGEDYYLMYQICQKLSKKDEAEQYRKEAADLSFTYEVPWKVKQ